ncbi:MAG: DNA internalization-related competence protein ComEC/Rec2 [Defluviitaleaceae bacterium]|nr:DNA internalization-related competence protein ComEC/Rec2 [Defluviitaleaceae bacterium]
MARPMVALVAFLVGGIIFGRYFNPDEHLLIFGLIATILAIIYFFVYKRKIALIFPAFAIIGAVFIANSLTPTDPLLEEVAQRHGFVRIEGIVEDVSTTRTGRQRVSIRTIAFRIGPSEEVHQSALGIVAYLPEDVTVSLGQRILVSGYLLPLDGPRNPGGFDEFQFLRSRGIDYKIFAEAASAYEIILTPTMHIRNFGVHLSAVFDEVLPPWAAGIMKAMIVGDRTSLDNEVREMYRSVGMFHILVVSGLHVSILAIALEKSLAFFGVSLKRRSLLTIVFIVLFAILTGAGVATVRAAIMGIALVISGLVGYENDTPTSMSLAAIALLLYQPLFLFDPGFIYSFSVVLALSLGTTPTDKALAMLATRHSRLAPLLNNWYVKKYLAGTLAANAAYFIVNAWLFYEVSPVSPLVNFILLPSVFFVIVLGFAIAIIGIFGAIGLFLANILAFPLWILLTIYNFVISWSLRLPYATMVTGQPSLAVLLISVAAIIAFLYIMHADKNIAKRLRIVGITMLVGFSASFIVARASPYIHITFLDVGQGESVVVSRGTSAIIIDGGGAFGRDVGENVGTHTLMPYLSYRGITQATAIATHNHRDHTLGLVEAMYAGRIEHLILAYANSEPEYYMYQAMQHAATATNTPISYISAGDVIEFGDMRIYALFPYNERTFRETNNASLVLLLVHGENSILLTGDIYVAVEEYLVARGTQINVDILQLAHHGSRTSTSDAFLTATSPQLAIISSGRNNMFGHPHPTVTRRLHEHDVPYHNTATHGAILIRSNGRNLQVRTMLNP